MWFDARATAALIALLRCLILAATPGSPKHAHATALLSLVEDDLGIPRTYPERRERRKRETNER